MPNVSHWVWCALAGQLYVGGIATCKRDSHEQNSSAEWHNFGLFAYFVLDSVLDHLARIIRM